MKRWLRRLGFGLAALVTLGALLLAVENYRGKRAWDQCRRELEAKGEKLDWASHAPAPMADEQNFTRSPALSRWLARARESTNGSPPVPAQWPGYLAGADWRSGRLPEPAEWQRALRHTNNSTAGDADWVALRERAPGAPLADVRFLLERRAAELAELRAAARRPAARLGDAGFPDVGKLLPQFAVLKSVALTHRAAALYALESGDAETALADVQVILALADAAGSEPLLISGLVQVALCEIAVQPVWGGLARHRWTDTQLAALQARLERENLAALWQRIVRGERAYGLALFEGAALAAATEGTRSGGQDNETVALSRALRSMPGGLRRQNEIRMARLGQFFLERAEVTGPWMRLAPDLEAQAQAIVVGPAWYRALALPLVPGLTRAFEKAALEQSTVSLAVVACALERYRLAQQDYPEALAALVPTYLTRLPVDPANGQALRYRRDTAGRFTLYSVGSNLKDDEGATAKGKDGRLDTRQGDWVWRSDPR